MVALRPAQPYPPGATGGSEMNSSQADPAAAEHTHAGDRRPASLESLIAALTNLPAMMPVDRARAIPALIEATKTILARERGAAMAAATGPGGISRAELARQLGISKSKVTEAIAAAGRSHNTTDPAAASQQEPR